MTRVSTATLLSLEQYFELLGLQPTHAQNVICQAFPVRTDVTSTLFKYSWQEFSHAGHEEIAYAISQAEVMITEMLGYFPAPCAVEEELQYYPFQHDADINVRSMPPSRYTTVKLKNNKFIKGGRRQLDLLERAADIVYSSEDGDTYDEFATITVAGVTTTGWREKDIAVYRVGYGTELEERVRGLRVAFSGTDIIITGNSALFVDPELWEQSTGGRAINGDVAGNFLDHVDVYHEYISSDTDSYCAVEYLYQDADAPIPLFTASRGSMQVFDDKRSVVSLIPGVWNTTTLVWDNACLSFVPNLIKGYYQSGVDSDKQGRMKMPYARAIAALATALITKPIVTVGPQDNLQHHWQAVPPPEYLNYAQASCPWGSRNGAYEAYSFMLRMADVAVSSV